MQAEKKNLFSKHREIVLWQEAMKNKTSVSTLNGLYV